MAAITARQIIVGALRKLGAYDGSMDGETAAMGLDVLNTMIDAWAADRLYAYNTEMVVASLPTAAQTRTIGPGAQINVEWPIGIQEGSFTRNGSIDYPLASVDVTKYNEVTYKTIGATWPEVVYYDKTLPTGTLYFYPVPATNLELHLAVLTRFSQFANLDTAYNFPPAYKLAMTLLLAEAMQEDIGRLLPPQTLKRVSAARRAVKRMNVVPPTLHFDRAHGRRFNILGNT